MISELYLNVFFSDFWLGVIIVIGTRGRSLCPRRYNRCLLYQHLKETRRYSLPSLWDPGFCSMVHFFFFFFFWFIDLLLSHETGDLISQPRVGGKYRDDCTSYWNICSGRQPHPGKKRGSMFSIKNKNPAFFFFYKNLGSQPVVLSQFPPESKRCSDLSRPVVPLKKV